MINVMLWFSFYTQRLSVSMTEQKIGQIQKTLVHFTINTRLDITQVRLMLLLPFHKIVIVLSHLAL